MKVLLVLLLERINPPWWRMRWSKGDPPEEREGHFILPAMLTVIKAKLTEEESKREDDTRS